MKRVLFIDRDGTLINEAPPTYQLDSFDKLTFYPGVFEYLGRIAKELDFELVMPTNQDGLGTASFPIQKINNNENKKAFFLSIIFETILNNKTAVKNQDKKLRNIPHFMITLSVQPNKYGSPCITDINKGLVSSN